MPKWSQGCANDENEVGGDGARRFSPHVAGGTGQIASRAALIRSRGSSGERPPHSSPHQPPACSAQPGGARVAARGRGMGGVSAQSSGGDSLLPVFICGSIKVMWVGDAGSGGGG